MGKCLNEKCPAFKDEITWINLGYGKFDIAKSCYDHICQGKGCGQKIQGKTVKTMGFTQATLKVVGKLIKGDVQQNKNLTFQET